MNKRRICTTAVILLIMNSLIVVLDTRENNKINVKGYVEHGPIVIDSDEDFETYGFNGSGSAADPYRIERLRIHGDSDICIEISDTSKFFVIRYCYLYDSYKGIVVSNALSDTVIIANNTIVETSSTCISVYSSNHLLVTNNTIWDGGIGISVTYSNYVTISNNICYKTSKGIQPDHCNYVWVMENYLKSCTTGYYSFDTDYLYIWNNTVTVSDDIGIHLYSVIEAEIIDNLIHKSIDYGAYLDWCYDVYIQNNTFYQNKYLNEPQAYDNEENLWFNDTLSRGNYWSDYSGMGNYTIDGSTATNDTYPLSEPPVPITIYEITIPGDPFMTTVTASNQTTITETSITTSTLHVNVTMFPQTTTITQKTPFVFCIVLMSLSSISFLLLVRKRKKKS